MTKPSIAAKGAWAINAMRNQRSRECRMGSSVRLLMADDQPFCQVGSYRYTTRGHAPCFDEWSKWRCENASVVEPCMCWSGCSWTNGAAESVPRRAQLLAAQGR